MQCSKCFTDASIDPALKTEKRFQSSQHELHPHGCHDEPHKAGHQGLRALAKVRSHPNGEKQSREGGPRANRCRDNCSDRELSGVCTAASVSPRQ